MVLGTKEKGWGDTLNICNGCSRNCLYCYGKIYACYRYKRILPTEWQNMKLRKNILEKKWPFPKEQGRYMFPTFHDITEEFQAECFQVIENVVRHQGYDMLIVTKPDFEMIRELCVQFRGLKEKIEIRFTITSMFPEVLDLWEPNASDFKERYHALVLASKLGYNCSVSIEPFLDWNPIPLVHKVEKYCSSVWLGPMNHVSLVKQNVKEMGYKWPTCFEERYCPENLAGIHAALKTHAKVHFKDEFDKKLTKKFPKVKANKPKRIVNASLEQFCA